ncbi:MAG: carboxymuconolactone decarboxylase family protein [Candidatus Dormibacteraceae bacterium]
MQGKQFEAAADAFRNGDLEAAGLPPREQLLVEFAGTVARAAHRVTDVQVEGLREAGWADEQIAEAAYVAALFSLFVRLADTFGIEPPAIYEPTGIPGAITRDL